MSQLMSNLTDVSNTTTSLAPVEEGQPVLALVMSILVLCLGCCCLSCLCACMCACAVGIPEKYHPQIEEMFKDLEKKGYLPKLNDSYSGTGESSSPSADGSKQLGEQISDLEDLPPLEDLDNTRTQRARRAVPALPVLPVPIPAPASPDSPRRGNNYWH
eukprot:gb/GFBE01037793.1/.p1 GENE.gb/GFBE01037793.1/~~gb/GFBE01037793.1/.p1  ORF type:complete len:159 (+),score=16.85 gb/GFBE01037793.1/:1-477(+)